MANIKEEERLRLFRTPLGRRVSTLEAVVCQEINEAEEELHRHGRTIRDWLDPLADFKRSHQEFFEKVVRHILLGDKEIFIASPTGVITNHQDRQYSGAILALDTPSHPYGEFGQQCAQTIAGLFTAGVRVGNLEIGRLMGADSQMRDRKRVPKDFTCPSRELLLVNDRGLTYLFYSLDGPVDLPTPQPQHDLVFAGS